MPYTMATLPDFVKKLPDKKQRQWLAVWSSAHDRCVKGGGDTKVCETRAFKQANGVTMSGDPEPEPEPVPAVATVDFSDSGPLYADDEEVIRTGLLFRSGIYPDKDFAMTTEELAIAAEAFAAPVPVDLDHHVTILDGKLGRVCALEARGDELHGTVALPRWLDDVIGGADRKVSATWDRATKTLQGLALVVNPRVEDAALLSAFSTFAAARHDTPHGRMALQELHDTAARSGAVCKASNANMASSHENSAIQSIHDTAVAHGAACSALKAGTKPGYPMFGSQTAGKPAGKEPAHMSKFEQFLAWLANDTAGEVANGEAAAAMAAVTPPPAASGGSVTPTAPSSKPDPAAEALRQANERAAQFEAENRRLRAERIQADAVRFADDQLREARAVPAEREQIIAAYTQAATDDANYGAVTFGDGTTGDRVSVIRKVYEARPIMPLMNERLKSALVLANQMETITAASKAKDAVPTDAEIADLMGLTAFGAKVVHDRKNGSN